MQVYLLSTAVAPLGSGLGGGVEHMVITAARQLHALGYPTRILAPAGSVAAASLAAKGDITVDTALLAIAAALGSNLIVKTVLAFTAGGRRFGLRFLAGMAAPAVVFGVVLAVTMT